MKNKLIEVLSVQSYSKNQGLMMEYIKNELKSIGVKYYIDNGNIYATKGKSKTYPCIVSHMDTVHPIVSNLSVIEIDGKLTGFNKDTMSQTGIGGDDKVGIFIALQCLNHFDNIKAVFFRDEEIGCEGSYIADSKFFNDCGFVLQCDRQRYGDFVTNASGVELSSTDFQDAVLGILNEYGYSFCSGGMTDVMALKEIGIDVSMANISCSYYNPHSSKEYVHILEVNQVLGMVMDIIKTLHGKSFPHEYIDRRSYQYEYSNIHYNSKYGWQDDYHYKNPDNKSKESDVDYCDGCDIFTEVRFIAQYDCQLCDRCMTDYNVEDIDINSDIIY